jgi:hypothetical protein
MSGFDNLTQKKVSKEIPIAIGKGLHIFLTADELFPG